MDAKYPRTPHLPWSHPGPDDVVANLLPFRYRNVVVTEKMDGENTTLSREGWHARSLNSGGGLDRSWVARLWGEIHWLIPEGWRICGENLYARHSIAYRRLASYFQVFSVWQQDRCCSWNETLDFCRSLELTTVRELYRGAWDKRLIRSLFTPIAPNGDEMEGYVVRVAEDFWYDEFAQRVAKYVRPNHVQTDEHWRHRPLVVNQLAKEG